MKKDDLIIFLIGLLLLGSMLITIFIGRGKSRHGVGVLLDAKPGQEISAQKKSGLDLGQRNTLSFQV
jgi:hypothetical protein